MPLFEGDVEGKGPKAVALFPSQSAFQPVAALRFGEGELQTLREKRARIVVEKSRVPRMRVAIGN